MSASVISVNVGRVRTGSWTGRVGRSAIDKRPVLGPVAVRRDGLEGDTVCDRRDHGSPENAVYAFAREDLDHFEALVGRPLTEGQFGENLTTSWIDVNAAIVGERWRVGTALLEVAKVRTACRVFQGWMEHEGFDATAWIKRFTAERRPGPYFRVVEEGVVQTGDPVVVEHRPDHGVSAASMFQALTGDRALLRELVAVETLPEAAHGVLLRRLGDDRHGPTRGLATGA